jgi:hypothetical protein
MYHLSFIFFGGAERLEASGDAGVLYELLLGRSLHISEVIEICHRFSRYSLMISLCNLITLPVPFYWPEPGPLVF